MLTQIDWDVIQRCILLKALDRADLVQLIEAGSVANLSRNQQLSAHGDPAKALFLVVDG